MGAPTITVQLPVPVYTRLQTLATREHTDMRANAEETARHETVERPLGR